MEPKMDESSEFPVDRELNLSNEHFKDILTDSLTGMTFHQFEFLKTTAAYPTPRTLATMSKNSYENRLVDETDEEYRRKLTSVNSSWILLTTGSNEAKGNTYFGSAFWNPRSQQIVVASRGSKTASSFSTDYFGILDNQITFQQLSSCTFAHRISAAAREVEEETGVPIQIFLTGHSLGGWLSSIMAFSLKYLHLNQEGTHFVRIPEDERNSAVHSTAVGFDSPGSRAMLLKMTGIFHLGDDKESKLRVINALDLRSYFAAPNAINTCTKHTGQVYRIFTDIDITESWSMLSVLIKITLFPASFVLKIAGGMLMKLVPSRFKSKSWIQLCSYWLDELLVFPSLFVFQYNKEAHSINGIIKALEQDDICIQEIVKFPRFKTDPSLGKIVSNLNVAFLIGQEYAFAFDQLKELNKPIPMKETTCILVPVKKKRRAADILIRFLIRKLRINPSHSEDEQRNEFYETREISTNAWPVCVFDKLEQSFLEAYERLRDLLCLHKYLPEDEDYDDVSIWEELHKYSIIKEDYDKGKLKIECQNISNFVSFTKRLLKLFPDLKNGSSIFHKASLCYVENQIKPNCHIFSTEEPEWYRTVRLSDNPTVFKVGISTQLTLARLYQYLESNTDCETIYFDLETLISLSEAFDLGDYLNWRKTNTSYRTLHLILEHNDKVDCKKFKKVLEQLNGVIKTTIVTSSPVGIPTRHYEATLKWGDLSINGKEKLLEKEVIVLQTSKVSLASMLKTKTESFRRCFHKVMDESTIAKLIQDEEIIIGNDLPELGDRKNYGIARTLLVPQVSDSFFSKKYQNKEEHMKIENEQEVVAINGDDSNAIIQDEEIIIGNDLPELGDMENYGIARTLLVPQVSDCFIDKKHQNKEEHMKSENKQEVVAINGDDSNAIIHHLFKFAIEPEDVVQLEDTERGKVIVLVILSGPLSQLQCKLKGIPLVESKRPNNVYTYSEDCFKDILHICGYWVQFQAGKFYFIHTNGDLKDVTTKVTQTELSTDDFIQLLGGNWAVVLSDEAGSGKTTMVNILSRKMKNQNSSRWVISVNLNKHTQALEKLQNNPLTNVTEAIDFFVCDVCKIDSEEFEGKLLKWSLTEGGRVVLLFDGYDEICPKFKDVTRTFLGCIRTSRVDNLFVTARSHSVRDLEDTFGVVPYNLKPFETDDQIKFLVQYWSSKALSVDDLESKALTLVDLFSKSIQDADKSFMGIPLQCRLLAEVYEEKLTRSDNWNTVSLYDLYREFVEKKLQEEAEKYGTTKSQSGEVNHHLAALPLESYHSELALRLLLDEDQFSRLRLDLVSVDIKELMASKAKRVGIVTSTEPEWPQFIHRTFAEYFVAVFFYKQMDTPNRTDKAEIEILFTEILEKPKFKLVRRFFEGLLKRRTLTETHYLIYGSVIANAWKNNKKSYIWFGIDIFDDEKTALVLAVLESNEAIYKFLVSCCLANDDIAIEMASYLTNRWYHVQQVPLVATTIERPFWAEFFLDQLEIRSDEVRRLIFPISIFDEMMTWSWQKKFHDYELWIKMLSHRPRLGNLYREMLPIWKSIRELIEFASAGNVAGMKAILEDESINGDTRLYILAAGRSDTRFQNTHYYRHETALRMAVGFNKVDSVHYLLEKGAMDIPLFRRNATPLFAVATVQGNLEIFQLLLDHASDKVTYLTSWEVLLNGIRTMGFSDVLKYLLENGYFGKDGEVLGEFQQTSRYNLLQLNVRAVDESGRTLLHRALANHNYDVAFFLIEKGADLNAVDDKGNTPIHMFFFQDIAVHSFDISHMHQLFRNEEIIWKIKNDNGDTAVDVALRLNSNSFTGRNKLLTLLPTLKVVRSLSNELRQLFRNLALSHHYFKNNFSRFVMGEVSSTDDNLIKAANETGLVEAVVSLDRMRFVNPILASFFVVDYTLERLQRISDTENDRIFIIEFIKTISSYQYFDFMLSLNIVMNDIQFEESTLKACGSLIVPLWMDKPEWFYVPEFKTVFHCLSMDSIFNLLKFLVDCCLQQKFSEILPLLLAGRRDNKTFLDLDNCYYPFEKSQRILDIALNCFSKLPRSAKRIIFLSQIVKGLDQAKLQHLVGTYSVVLEVTISFAEAERWRQLVFNFLETAAKGSVEELRNMLHQLEDDYERRYLLTLRLFSDYRFVPSTALDRAIANKNNLVVDYLVSEGATLSVRFNEKFILIDRNHREWPELFEYALNDS